jgi:hypothetical protein
MKKQKKARILQLEWKEECFSLRIPVQAFKPTAITITATEFIRLEQATAQAPKRDLAA